MDIPLALHPKHTIAQYYGLLLVSPSGAPLSLKIKVSFARWRQMIFLLAVLWMRFWD